MTMVPLLTNGLSVPEGFKLDIYIIIINKLITKIIDVLANLTITKTSVLVV
jgi:hypothetical protein